MREQYNDQLRQLGAELGKMGQLCEKALALTAQALTEWDADLGNKIAEIDSEIDRMEHTIESDCLKLLLRQQPIAHDLREVSAALKMITDMERIGDQAEDIAEIIGFLGGRTAPTCVQIGQMAHETIVMVTGSVDAYAQHDLDLANAVLRHDDIVDAYFDSVKKSLIDMISQNPTDSEFALDLLMIAKYFERIGDHATNIAEWVVFAVTGVHKSLEEM